MLYHSSYNFNNYCENNLKIFRVINLIIGILINTFWWILLPNNRFKVLFAFLIIFQIPFLIITSLY